MHDSYLQNVVIGLKPIARLTPAAKTKIYKGDPLLKVPAGDIFTTFDDYPWEKYYSDQNAELKAAAMLISYKLDNSSSIARSNYTHQFPCDIEPPGHWLEDDLKIWLTKFVECPHLVRDKFPYYDKFKEIASSIEGVQSLAYEVRSYAWTQAITRTHGLEITKKDWKILRGLKVEENDEKIKGYAFVLLFELFNQYLIPDRFHPEPTYPVEFNKGEFILRAQRDYNIGEETYVPYKRKNNYKLLEDYGFTIPYNRHSFIEITVNTYSDHCKNTDNGCVFQLNPVEFNKNYLAYFEKSKNPLFSYRQGVINTIKNYKFALRHQRRRVKILEDRNLKQIFHLSISEKWTAYKALSLVDREILKSQINSLKLV